MDNRDIYINRIKQDLIGPNGELEEVIAKTQKIVIPNNLSNVITKVTRYQADKYILTLKNGQQWKVLEPSRKGYFKINQNMKLKLENLTLKIFYGLLLSRF